MVAQYNASHLITQRESVSREIRKILTERAAFSNIALDDVSITNLTFGKEFTAEIEAKQVAAQEAERAKFVVEKAEQDKRSAIIRAKLVSRLIGIAFTAGHITPTLPIRLNIIHRLLTVGRSFVTAPSLKTSRGRVMDHY